MNKYIDDKSERKDKKLKIKNECYFNFQVPFKKC